MLQIESTPFASDALEDAMRLAQTKAINSYTWSDMLNYLNYAWSDIYNRVAMIDDGYYSVTVRLNTLMTKIPPFVKNTIRVYAAQHPIGFSRQIYRASGMNDLRSRNTYHISGFDLFCPDAMSRIVWLNYVPMAPMLFFPINNRDPKLYEKDSDVVVEELNDYGMYKLIRTRFGNRFADRAEEYDSLVLQYRNTLVGVPDFDVLRVINDLDNDPHNDDWKINYINCDFPYIFITLENRFTAKRKSGFFKDIINFRDFVEYNPFSYTGRDNNVEYLKTKWNDKTGLGVIIRDWNDYDEREKRYRIKELGWTPDTKLIYPCPEMYRYLVARLADKFAAFNESSAMGVAKELTEAQYAFEAFCARDKSAWNRIDNVNGPYINDWL